MELRFGKQEEGTRRLVAGALAWLIVWFSAGHSFAEQAGGRTSTTRPEISEEVSPLLAISPIARDGHRGEGFVRKPPGKGPFPAAILIHGGLTRRPTNELREYTSSTHPSRFLAAGYVTVVITYRGREIDPTAQTPLPVSDCVAAIEYVKGLSYVDPDSILVTGTSGGGDLTLESAAQTQVAAIAPEEPAAVLMAGLVVADSSVAQKADYVQLYAAKRDHRKFRAKIAAIDSPILILQGDHDTHSGLNRFTAEVLVPELEAAGKFFEVVTYPGEPHTFSFSSSPERTPRPAAALKAFRDIDAFARRFIKVQPLAIEPSRVRFVPVGYAERPEHP
jgi:dipeptidyl aminopeptidase/acylaminoacyl peptidase